VSFRREFGVGGPSLSILSLGTMRLSEEVEGKPVAHFLCELAERGVDTHHSSHEYDTDPLYCRALAQAKTSGAEFQHIVKLAEPSWDDLAFDGTRFQRSVDDECRRLGTEQLAVVQWMVRTKSPTDDAVRLPLLQRDRELMAEAFDAAKRTGQVGAIALFGYTPEFTKECLADNLVDGVTSYLNPWETDAEALAQTVPTIAIRPFAGGRAFEKTPADNEALSAESSGQPSTIEDLIRYPFRANATVSVLASFSSTSHANQLIGALSEGLQ